MIRAHRVTVLCNSCTIHNDLPESRALWLSWSRSSVPLFLLAFLLELYISEAPPPPIFFLCVLPLTTRQVNWEFRNYLNPRKVGKVLTKASPDNWQNTKRWSTLKWRKTCVPSEKQLRVFRLARDVLLCLAEHVERKVYWRLVTGTSPTLLRNLLPPSSG